ncbi:BCL-6 corepressor isoform X3 [Boleophthalmus pectinirostris]|uniref:BCL-6 corepressor isoform X3 n=1 Tax=Boleophthalmus pectinirostris TaxID=150288 RepID=UPI00243006FC|nr:BCL-6 corepressor isoform X3 [Boleophthalmus pectinirostris]
MVDARLTPLAAMGLDRGALMHDGLRLHSGVVYPGIRALPSDKSRESAGLPLGYSRDGLPELIYKPDATLDSRKPANGYLGLYKGTPPSLHKPVMVPGADGLGLECRVGPGEKSSELGLAGAGGSYLRLPWLSPYPEASMYPFMESSKFAALNMYKASLLSQPNPYLPQHLAYPSLCAAQGGNVTPAAAPSPTDRLYYMPPYPPSPISSPLGAPPMRIPAVSVAPTSMAHCQEKGLGVAPSYPPQLHQLSPHPPHHQAAPDRDRSPNRSSRPSRPPSRKTCSSSNNGSAACVNENGVVTSDCSPLTPSRLSQPPPGLTDSSLDLQRPVARIGQLPVSTNDSVSTAQSTSHPFSVTSIASDQCSPSRPSTHKPRPRDAVPELKSGATERRSSRSPSKPTVERPAHPSHSAVLTKDPVEKPLDLSGRMLEFGLPPNGFSVKMETLASGGRYGPPHGRELQKDNMPTSPSSHAHSVVSSTSSKVTERPEMISTLHSSWVVPTSSQHASVVPTSPRPFTDLGPSHGKSSSPAIRNRGIDRPAPQERSSSCPKKGEPNRAVSSSQNTNSSHVSSRPLSPKPSSDWIKQSPSQYELIGHHREGADKTSQATKRSEPSPEVLPYKRPCLENGHPSGHLYLPQNEAYLNHSMTYANRYLHYPIPDSMALHPLSLTGKGPVYPHPVLLGGNSLYPTHLAPKHALPYHNIPGGPGGEYLAYNSQEMAHPLMHPHSDGKHSERGDPKSRGQEKPRTAVDEFNQQRRNEKDPTEISEIRSAREMGAEEQERSQSKSMSTTSRENIVCIDLVHSDTDIDNEPTPAVHQKVSTEPTIKNDQNECCESNPEPTKTVHEPKLSKSFSGSQVASPKSNYTEKQSEKSFEETNVPQDTCSKSPSAPELDVQAEDSLEENCPSPEPDDPSTLHCARTSGQWSSRKDKGLPNRSPVSSPRTDIKKDATSENFVPEKMFEKEDSIVDLGESQGEAEEEEDESNHNSSKHCRGSSLAKRIANSSGYVGDRFKCVTTELYADSSKLSREQRALQMEVISQEGSNVSQPAANWERAMMRFSELELKEKESGSVCVSASAVAAGRELADSQRRERALEPSQASTRQGERDGCRPAFGSRVPVFQKHCGQREPLSPGQANHDPARSANVFGLKDVNKKVTKDSEGHCIPPTLTLAKAHTEERFGTARKRPKTDSEDRDRDEAERRCHGEKKPKISPEGHTTPDEDDDDEVHKLKVCIELKGLRLSKPTTGTPSPDRPQIKQERVWHQNRLLSSAQSTHKFRSSDTEERLAAQRAEINRKWGCEKFNGAAPSLSPGQLKDRVQLPNPFSGDRGHKEHRRGPTSPNQELSVGGPNLFKARRHSDADKPKGKRPCKTKHTSQKERERDRRKEPTPASPAQRCTTDLGAPEDDKEVVLYCLENKVCEVNHKDYAGYCALHEACARGWLNIVQHLLDYGADINCSAQDGTRPIHDAVENDHLDVVRVLLSYGADPTLATYSGRGLLKMTHSDGMERFLTDYFADLQGRSYDDPGLYWEFYGSAVCESTDECGVYDILADPPGPDDGDEDDKRELFEFEFSDRPLLPCYNIQVSLSQGPRNWLLLSDVLRRLRMSARGFRQAFPHMEVVTVAEAEFYRQASLSQLFSCPEELEGFHSDSKELLDLVEDSAELAALLGSSLECLDDRWDHPGDKLKDKIKAVGKLVSS